MKNIARWFKSIKKELFFLGILSIAIGVVMVLYPDTVNKVICYVIGAILVISGGFVLTVVLVNKGAKPFSLRVIAAALAVAVGALFIFGASFVFDILWVFMGIGIIMNSYFKTQYAYELRYSGSPRWWINLVISMISLALGIILILNRAGEPGKMIKLTGIFLAIDGLCDLASVLTFLAEFRRIRKEERAVEKERLMQEKLSKREAKLAKKMAKKKKKDEAVINLSEVVAESKEQAAIEEDAEQNAAKTEEDTDAAVSGNDNEN
ncbi:MAG: DUF308 domain-containing protein [Lachnospiraceae bacterium]|nr:DUF308 domain-containing protein [Lachnospiraceae bacterium]